METGWIKASAATLSYNERASSPNGRLTPDAVIPGSVTYQASEKIRSRNAKITTESFKILGTDILVDKSKQVCFLSQHKGSLMEALFELIQKLPVSGHDF